MLFNHDTHTPGVSRGLLSLILTVAFTTSRLAEVGFWALSTSPGANRDLPALVRVCMGVKYVSKQQKSPVFFWVTHKSHKCAHPFTHSHRQTHTLFPSFLGREVVVFWMKPSLLKHQGYMCVLSALVDFCTSCLQSP